jgi:lipopolysaccharide transport system permease protein
MGLGLGIIISSLTTKYKDLNVLISFGIQLLMYVTPVPFLLSYLKNKSYRYFIGWNPLSPLVDGFRYSLFGEGIFPANMFIYSIACSTVILLTGIILFNKVECDFMDTV